MIFSPFWRLEVSDQDASKFGFCRGLPSWPVVLVVALLFGHLENERVQGFLPPLTRTPALLGQGPSLWSFNLNHPAEALSHWGLGLQRVNWVGEGTQFTPQHQGDVSNLPSEERFVGLYSAFPSYLWHILHNLFLQSLGRVIGPNFCGRSLSFAVLGCLPDMVSISLILTPS